MHIDFNAPLTDAWGKPIMAKEGSDEAFVLGDAVVDALNFVERGKEPTEEEKRRRWRLVLRLTRPSDRIEESTRYPTLEVGKDPLLTPDDLSLMQRCVHGRWQSPMIYTQCWDLLCGA